MDCLILVVEDDTQIRELLVEVLTDEGHMVLSAGDGRAALDLLATLPTPPDLMYLDMMMPVMDGSAFLQERLGDPVLIGIPVIVLSAMTNLQHQVRGLQVTVALPKPVQIDIIIEMADRYCR